MQTRLVASALHPIALPVGTVHSFRTLKHNWLHVPVTAVRISGAFIDWRVAVVTHPSEGTDAAVDTLVDSAPTWLANDDVGERRTIC